MYSKCTRALTFENLWQAVRTCRRWRVVAMVCSVSVCLTERARARERLAFSDVCLSVFLSVCVCVCVCVYLRLTGLVPYTCAFIAALPTTYTHTHTHTDKLTHTHTHTHTHTQHAPTFSSPSQTAPVWLDRQQKKNKKHM